MSQGLWLVLLRDSITERRAVIGFIISLTVQKLFYIFILVTQYRLKATTSFLLCISSKPSSYGKVDETMGTSI